MKIFILLTFIISYSEASQLNNQINTLDSFAENYVKLGLELGEYDSDYVDAYLGPEKWHQLAKQNRRSKQQLATDIHQLFEKLKGFDALTKEARLRKNSLLLNLRAMDTRIRMVNGEKFLFKQEAFLIYDAILPDYTFAQFDDVLIEIDKLIPGDTNLAERVEAFRKRFDIPTEKVKRIVDVAIDECRIRTKEHIQLPSQENFKLEYVTKKNWSGYNWYQGKNTSLMQINLDFPMKIDRAIKLGCHEGYPGHHVWNLMIENKLLNQKNWIEFSLFPLFSPYALIAEGSANYGIELAFQNEEKMIFEKQQLFPLAGLDPAQADALNQLNKLTEQLSFVRNLIAQKYLDGEIPRTEAVDLTVKYSMTSKQRAEQSIRFIEQYRTYILNYNFGLSVVTKYIESQSDTTDGRWKAFELMLTELKTASKMTVQE
jgi:hypothetical protein